MQSVENRILMDSQWLYFEKNMRPMNEKKCVDCNEIISEGEYYYEFDDGIFCQGCIDSYVEEHRKNNY